MSLVDDRYCRLMLDLLRTNTISPLEVGEPTDLATAQLLYAEAAKAIGFEVILHAPAPPSALTGPSVPRIVIDASAQMGASFLESQPNLLLRLGPPRPRASTIMFNFHMDTVTGREQVTFRDGSFFGRGSVDCKGAGVAILAGVEAALARERDLFDDVTVLVQCVGGEEGGAMGFYGTRHLVHLGHVGRFNVFAEPSSGVFFDHSTTSMTLRLSVNAAGSTDDAPERGVNATVLLGYMAVQLAEELGPWLHQRKCKLCVAGLHTGHMHNRVYGRGDLLVNCAYPTRELGAAIAQRVDEVIQNALSSFVGRFAAAPAMKASVDALPDALDAVWTKRDLPVLANRDRAVERLLDELGFRRCPEERSESAFTCDAIWVQDPGSYTIVFGPGDLVRNRAHAPGEFLELAAMEDYAHHVSVLLSAFRRAVATNELQTGPTSEN